MINWCCCWCKMLLLMIHAMGVHDYEICGEIWIVLESFMKNGWIGDCDRMMFFDSSFIWFWVSFYAYKRLDKLWGWIWVLGNQNWSFWSENGVFPESIVVGLCHNSSWRVGGELGRVLPVGTRHGEWNACHGKLHSNNIPCFTFLRLYHTFLFWIGFLSKHENFRYFS